MNSPESKLQINAVPLTRAAYEPYGKVIAADDELPFKLANMGTAKRYNFLCEVENRRPAEAKLNLCVFRCSPLAALPLEMKLLEKHQRSTQAFIPMANNAKYLAIVCLGADKPELSTVAAFLVEGAAGVSYYPGVWHYPMTALETAIDFSCLVYEDGSADDCIIAKLEQPVFIQA